VGTLSTPGVLALDGAFTLGNLLVPSPDTAPRWAPMPSVGGDLSIEPNVDRAALEIDWTASWAVRDGPGDDLVVYEHGDPINEPEAFSVAVHDARTGEWSARRWEFFDVFSATDLLFVTGYDLADFGLPGGVVDRVRIESVFGVAAAMPDRVSDASGQGFVLRAGESGWDTAHLLRLVAGGAGPPTDLLDADLLWVSALHPLVEPSCCVR